MQPSKVALITGSAKRRVGWHVADALGRRGYAVVIHYNTSAATPRRPPMSFAAAASRRLALAADLADEQQVRDLVGQHAGASSAGSTCS